MAALTEGRGAEMLNDAGDITTGDDLYASTCSWLEESVGMKGAGEALLAAVAVALVALAALAWRTLRRADHAPDKLGHKVNEAKSMLEEITERERQRRLGLEAEVEQLRELKRKKAEDIERFRKIKDEEERKVRERQELAQQEAQRKKELELAQEQLEKEALRRAHTEGMLCVLKDARAALPDVTLRVPLVDSVEFPTTISHLKSRIRADYIDQPLEHRQRIVHGGKPQADSIKLIDIFNQHSPKTEPVPFFVIVGQELPALVPRQHAPAAPPQASAQVPEEPDPDAEVAVRVKRGKLGADILLTMRMRDTVEAICSEIADTGVPISCPSASGGSMIPAQLAGDLSRIRLVMYGRILKGHEPLSSVLKAELDQSSISLSVYVAPPADREACPAAGSAASTTSILSTEEASTIFDALDTNSDGEISMIEFIKGLRSNPDLARRLGLPSEIQQEAASRTIFQHTFGEMDADLSKSISREEFVRYYTRTRASAGGDHMHDPDERMAHEEKRRGRRGAARAESSEQGSVARQDANGDGSGQEEGKGEGNIRRASEGGGGGGGIGIGRCADEEEVALDSAQQSDAVSRKPGAGGSGSEEEASVAEVVPAGGRSRASEVTIVGKVGGMTGEDGGGAWRLAGNDDGEERGHAEEGERLELSSLESGGGDAPMPPAFQVVRSRAYPALQKDEAGAAAVQAATRQWAEAFGDGWRRAAVCASARRSDVDDGEVATPGVKRIWDRRHLKPDDHWIDHGEAAASHRGSALAAARAAHYSGGQTVRGRQEVTNQAGGGTCSEPGGVLDVHGSDGGDRVGNESSAALLATPQTDAAAVAGRKMASGVEGSVEVAFKMMGEQGLFRIAFASAVSVAQAKRQVASRLALGQQGRRIMLVVAGKVLKDEELLCPSAGLSGGRRGVAERPSQDIVVHVVLVNGSEACNSEPVVASPAPRLVTEAEGAGQDNLASLSPSKSVTTTIDAASAPLPPTGSAPAGGDRASAAASASAAIAQLGDGTREGGKLSLPDRSCGEVLGKGGDVIRIEVELSADDDESEEDEDDPSLELLVATTVTIGELADAVSARLPSCGKGGSRVMSLDFGGRALSSSDALSLLFRVVSAATRQAWLSRERALVLGARLAPASGVTDAPAEASPPPASSSCRAEPVTSTEAASRGGREAVRECIAEQELEREERNLTGRPDSSSALQPHLFVPAASPTPSAASTATAACGQGDGAEVRAQQSTRAKRLVSIIVKDVLGGRRDLALQVAANLSLAELKVKLCLAYQDSPAPARQWLVYQGKHLRDDDTVGALLGSHLGAGHGTANTSAKPSSDVPLEIFVTIHPRM